MRKWLLATMLGTALVAPPAFSQDDTGEPPGFQLRGAIPATVKANPLPGAVRLNGDSLWLERDKLSAWARKLGVVVRERGTGAGAINWICLTQEKPGVRTWLISDSLADNVLIDGVIIAQTPGALARNICPAAPSRWSPELPNGLKLGMTTAELKSRLGAPSYDKGGLLGFVHVRRTITRDDVPAAVSASVWAQVVDGKVVLISLSQNTSNN